MFPPTMAYAIARLQHHEDLAQADLRRRSRHPARTRARGGSGTARTRL